MIKPHTLDQAIIEALRFVKAAKALRAADLLLVKKCQGCWAANAASVTQCGFCGSADMQPVVWARPEHAATLRASMDLTRKLADLRQGR